MVLMPVRLFVRARALSLCPPPPPSASLAAFRAVLWYPFDEKDKDLKARFSMEFDEKAG